MKRWQKTFAMALGVIIIAIGGAYFLVKSVLLPETVRLIIIPRLEEIVKRTISYRAVEVGLGGTISVKDISIGGGQPLDQELLIKARDMQLHCRILPLLSKKIIIERITLREPYFKLRRNDAGQFNVASYAPSSPGQSKANKNGIADVTRGASQTKLSLDIKSLAFQDGTFVFTDYFKRSAQPLETTLKAINGSLSDLSPVSPFSLTLFAEVVSTPPSMLRLKAMIDPLRKLVTSDIKLTSLDMTRFAPYLPSLPFSMNRGYCSVDLTMVVNSALDFSSRGLLRLTDVDIATGSTADHAFPDAFAEMIKNSEINLDHHFSYQSADDMLLVEKCAATLHGITVALKGKVESFRTDPRLDITVDADQLSAAKLFNALPPDLLPAIKNLSSSGTMKTNLSVKGYLKKPEELAMSGFLHMDKLAVQSDVPPRWKLELDGKAELKNQDVIINQLTAQTGTSPLTLSGKIANCLTGPLTAQLRISSASLNADEVISCITEMRNLKKMFEDDEEEGERERTRTDLTGYKNVRVDAEVDVDRFSYRNLVLSDLKASSRLSGGNFSLEALRGVMGDGSFSASGRIGLEGEGLDCTCRFTGNHLQLAPLLQALAPGRKEEVSGIADLALTFQGKGATSDTFKKNLSGEGNFTVRDGKVSGLKFLESLASFIKIDALKTLTFDESRGTFTISDGAIRLESSLKGKDVELYPTGTIGLDSALDLALDMRLAPQLSDQIADGVLTKYFKDDKGWTLLSLAIKAPAGGEVVIMPASSTIQNISEMLVDILLKKEGAPGNERQDKKKALEELLQKLMQKAKEAGAKGGITPPPE